MGNDPKGYSICCGKDKVQLPLLREAPPELHRLFTCGGHEGERFGREIQTYNNIFAFVSFGGDVYNSVNFGRGPFIFRVRGHTYRSIGSLAPPLGCTPKFVQFLLWGVPLNLCRSTCMMIRKHYSTDYNFQGRRML